MNTQSSRFLVVHGHFYQPPRENPWVDAIEMQPSSWPHHDWNERVYSECYAPNGASRLLDAKGRIRTIVNNYAHFSFNFGPTLLSWIEEKHPDTYERILEGDRLSHQRLGFGNAIAQVFNHLIMPLATVEEKTLQVRWAIQDFKSRFGRKPEGIWLAETAIDMETVECLIREGIRFTILAPTQADRIRPLHSDQWNDVSDGSINSRRPYRVFSSQDNTSFLDVFFYDGALSHGVGFDHLLRDATRFADRISQAFDFHDLGDQLVSVCTDGESYGHHEPYADMCASYLFEELCEANQWNPVNYAWYLDRHPPEFEVQLKNAHTGGTAWSCAHGVGRWKEDCGCSTGGEPGWNQQWRGPLRQALDILAVASRKTLAQKGPNYFKNWIEASSEAPASWNLNPETRRFFWSKHALNLPQTEASEILELLRYSHYMYTSCGWFFTDLTGIETAQVLKYALRALQLIERFGNNATEVRIQFLNILSTAISNLGKKGDQFFNELEKESLPTEAYWALARWTHDFSGELVPYATLTKMDLISESHHDFNHWRVLEYRYQHEFTVSENIVWLAFEGNGLDSPTYLILPEANRELAQISRELLRTPEDLLLHAKNDQSYRLAAEVLPMDIRDKLATSLRKRYWAENATMLMRVELALTGKQQQYARIHWPFPSSMSQMLHVIENFHLVEELETGLHEGSLASLQNAVELARRVRKEEGQVHLGAIKRELYESLYELGCEFLAHEEGIKLDSLFALLDLVDVLGLTAQRTRLENLAYPLFEQLHKFNEIGQIVGPISIHETLRLLDRLNFSTEEARLKLLSPKAGKP